MEKQEKRADRRGNDEEGKQGVISLFVENLPESLHWKGLWFAFARMENMGDANRAIQRLNGFVLYGSRLVVKIARDTQGWKRSTAGRSQSFEPKQTRNGKNVDAVVQKMEIGFNDGTSFPLCNKWKKVEKVNEKTEESVSESKSKTENNDKVEVEVNRSWSGMEEEAQEAMWAEKDFINEERTGIKWGEGSNPVDHMGYDYEIDEGSIKQLPEAKKNWADSLNEKLNTGKSWSRLSNGANTSEEELDRDCFAEIEEKKEKRRKKKAKKRQSTWGVVFAGPFSGRENVPISSCAVKTALQILKKAETMGSACSRCDLNEGLAHSLLLPHLLLLLLALGDHLFIWWESD
ncbi:hypothetical protein V6N12_073955 [Hibiscus sabdariffa]|uniref:RRM domain-containing protein n=1 Tax=Hibiscus sabdariffa TaxID=183260 RepID=A0ABR2AMJ4_9ROSI